MTDFDIDRRTALGLAGAGLGGGLLWNSTGASVAGRVSGPTTRPAVDDGDVEAYTHANAGFGLDLLGELAAEASESNLMISPLSVSAALAMTWAGARGETAVEMRKTLRFPHEQSTLHPAVGALQYDLNRRAEDVPRFEVPQIWRTNRFELTVANALWGQHGFPLAESFREMTDRYYGAGMRRVDFAGDPDGAAEEINDWAATMTDGRIDELFQEGVLDSQTRLVLTNAVYLLADWADPFDPDDTEPGTFTAIDGDEQRVPMMEQEADFRTVFDREEGYQAIELPYVGGDISMVLTAPWGPDTDFPEFESSVDAEWLTSLFADLDAASESETEVRMPRFEFEVETSLREMLGEMGMPTAFGGGANFDGMTPDDNGLFIDDVVHDTYVAVDEEGTEAAAATGVSMAVSAPPRVTLDRPFLFCIRDRETDAVLFLGRLVDAEAAT